MSNRRGLTLIETIAGIALLSTLLVGLLMAAGRHGGQIRSAQRRLVAIEAADALLSSWTAEEEATIPRNSRGQLGGEEEMQWRTRSRVEATREGLHIEIVRLEIVDMTMVAEEAEVLASVEVVVSASADMSDSERDE